MIRVGIVGCGYWGPNLVRNCVANPDIQVKRVCDINPQRLNFVKQQYPFIELSSRYEDLLKDDIDAVIIATPVKTHTPLALQALNAGKHVLVEKPFTTSVKEAEKLISAAQRRKLVLMVDHVFVYTPAVRKIKEICGRKQLGEIIYFDATRTNLGLFQRDTNVLWDLAPHDVAIMHFLLNKMPRYVSATGLSYFKNGLESMVYMTAFFDSHFDSHSMAHFHWSWLSPVKVRTILLGGDKKMVLYDDTQPSEKIKVYDKGVGSPSPSKQHDLFISYRSGDMIAPKLDNTEGLKLVCEDFVHCIRYAKNPISHSQFSLNVIRIIEAAQQSLRKGGQKVKVV
jgi:predicted dehydrogenase